MFNENLNKIILNIFIIFIIIFISIYLLKYFFQDNLSVEYFDNHKSVLVYNEYYDLKGSTKSVKNIYVNDREYFLDENNNFNIKLYLFEGVNIFNLKAVKKNNDYIYKKITIVREKRDKK